MPTFGMFQVVLEVGTPAVVAVATPRAPRWVTGLMQLIVPLTAGTLPQRNWSVDKLRSFTSTRGPNQLEVVGAENELPVVAEDGVEGVVGGGLSIVVVVNAVAVVVGCIALLSLLLLRFGGVFSVSQCGGAVFSSLHCCCAIMLLAFV